MICENGWWIDKGTHLFSSKMFGRCKKSERKKSPSQLEQTSPRQLQRKSIRSFRALYQDPREYISKGAQFIRSPQLQWKFDGKNPLQTWKNISRLFFFFFFTTRMLKHVPFNPLVHLHCETVEKKGKYVCRPQALPLHWNLDGAKPGRDAPVAFFYPIWSQKLFHRKRILILASAPLRTLFFSHSNRLSQWVSSDLGQGLTPTKSKSGRFPNPRHSLLHPILVAFAKVHRVFRSFLAAFGLNFSPRFPSQHSSDPTESD